MLRGGLCYLLGIKGRVVEEMTVLVIRGGLNLQISTKSVVSFIVFPFSFEALYHGKFDE